MTTHINLDDLFEPRITYPDSDARERFVRLVGLDEHKTRLTKALGTLVNPVGIREWADKFHPSAKEAITATLRMSPLVVLAGDIGTGKTELAESVGDAVARQENIDITLFPLSLATRGQGRVGEMTQLLSSAFGYVQEEATKLMDDESGLARGAILLLVDEADALAQSREATQMHHEDRAGVNALIRGVDLLGRSKAPAAVIMCTNRRDALDPAIRRRAADTLEFARPNDEQRRAVLKPLLLHIGFSEEHIEIMVAATGANERPHGFTFSDLTQRLLTGILLDAYPDQGINPARALEIAERMAPSAPFQEG